MLYFFYGLTYPQIIRKVLSFSLLCLLAMSLAKVGNAQEETVNKKLSKQKVASITSVINYLLLAEVPGGPIVIELGESNSGSFGYRYGQGDYKDGLEIHFEGQSETITLCFNAVDVQAGEVTVQLNGETINSFESGENCFTFNVSQQLSNNVLSIIHNNPGDRYGVNNISVNLANETWLTLPVLDRFEWDNLAVRKVLQIFAFGGHATDLQIQIWASMDPKDAIQEMLNFAPHNFKLSPLSSGEKYNQTALLDGTFWNFRDHMSSSSSSLPIDNGNDRESLGVDRYDSQGAWVRMTLARGFNPFRQKIGFWETNYHMAVNLDTAVTNRQLTYYYDLIMNAHAASLPYHQVIATAAKSAAVAVQYGHGVENANVRVVEDNRWAPRKIDVNNTPDNPYDDDLDYGDEYCECNEDFAREIHQLFFGILGEQDPLGLQHHEDVTIPETAKALTDMRVQYDNVNDRWPETVDFQTEFHHAGTVDILNTTISGANAAEKIDAIANVAIQHSESLANLPVWIIEGLAEDEISAQDKVRLQSAWAAMPALNKNFLEFIQAYAVSDLFHATNRVKYASSIDRMVYIGNKLVLNNTEALADFYRIGVGAYARSFAAENVEVFEPLHNVFGGQTGIEASDSAAVMENNYNRFADTSYLQTNSDCDDCDNGDPWSKDWASVIPKIDGTYKVENVAAWLWRHFIGDDGKNYTDVERAHTISILATNSGLNQLYCVQQRRIVEGIEPSISDINNNRTPLELLERDNPYVAGTERRCDNNLDAIGDPVIDAEIELLEHGFTSAELQTGSMVGVLSEMANRTINLDSNDPAERQSANEQIGRAINFILVTPFVMAQEAR